MGESISPWRDIPTIMTPRLFPNPIHVPIHLCPTSRSTPILHLPVLLLPIFPLLSDSPYLPHETSNVFVFNLRIAFDYPGMLKQVTGVRTLGRVCSETDCRSSQLSIQDEGG